MFVIACFCFGETVVVTAAEGAAIKGNDGWISNQFKWRVASDICAVPKDTKLQVVDFYGDWVRIRDDATGQVGEAFFPLLKLDWNTKTGSVANAAGCAVRVGDDKKDWFALKGGATFRIILITKTWYKVTGENFKGEQWVCACVVK